MTSQLNLLTSLEATNPPSAPSGHQHHRLLLALLAAGSRGLLGEEAAKACGIRKDHTATTRLSEMSLGKGYDPDRFPVPLVARFPKERATSTGVLAQVFRLTDEGARVAGRCEVETWEAK